jgi:hypothetical protein
MLHDFKLNVKSSCLCDNVNDPVCKFRQQVSAGQLAEDGALSGRGRAAAGIAGDGGTRMIDGGVFGLPPPGVRVG